jgi:hypothetical protein
MPFFISLTASIAFGLIIPVQQKITEADEKGSLGYFCNMSLYLSRLYLLLFLKVQPGRLIAAAFGLTERAWRTVAAGFLWIV